MAQDTFTEVTRQSWGSRLGGAFKGIIIGLALIAVGLFLLFSNEGRAVRRAKALDHGASAVVSVPATSVDLANEGKLVHVSGMVETDEILTDPEFGISVPALHLRRNVEMYQWQETTDTKTEKKVGGSTETTKTYNYQKGWSSHLQNSGSFKKPNGHENPASMPFQGKNFSASNATIGSFRLSSSLIGKITNWEPLALSGTSVLPEYLRSRAVLYSGGFYLGDDPTSPQVGDVQIDFQLVKPSAVSVVARQEGGALGPWTAKNGQTVELLSYGTVASEAMFESAQRSNTFLTWVLRLLGFLLIYWGINSVLAPLSVMADVIPVLGNLVGRGTKALSFFIAGFMAFCTIGFAWLFYRPMLGIGLLLLALAAIVVAIKMVKKAKAAPKPVAAPAAAPAAAAPAPSTPPETPPAAPPPPPPPPPPAE